MYLALFSSCRDILSTFITIFPTWSSAEKCSTAFSARVWFLELGVQVTGYLLESVLNPVLLLLCCSSADRSCSWECGEVGGTHGDNCLLLPITQMRGWQHLSFFIQPRSHSAGPFRPGHLLWSSKQNNLAVEGRCFPSRLHRVQSCVGENLKGCLHWSAGHWLPLGSQLQRGPDSVCKKLGCKWRK